MHPLTTLAKLNREAEEAAHLLNARSPAAPRPAKPVAEPTQGPDEFIRRAAAIKDHILNGAKG